MIQEFENEVEAKIFELLMEDSSLNANKIAKKLSIHPQTAKKYIDRLYKKNIILGCSLSVCHEEISQLYILLFKGGRPFKKKDFEIIMKRLQEKKISTKTRFVVSSYETSGEYTLVILVRTDKITYLMQYITELMENFKRLDSYVLLPVVRTNIDSGKVNLKWHNYYDEITQK